MSSEDIKAAAAWMIKEASQKKLGPEQEFEEWEDPDMQRCVGSIQPEKNIWTYNERENT